jgi:indole-3-glycerol phosphate synthase / phosphoribosylanthranilate isomerase
MSVVSLKTHPAGSALGRIIAQKIEDVSQRMKQTTLGELEPSDRSFYEALAKGRALIAEVKKRSPSKGLLRKNLDVEAIGRIYDQHAAAISVVTDEPFFGGSLMLLAAVRARVRRPVMLKDFVISEFQIQEARAYGADAVLLMASVLDRDSLAELYGLTRSLGMDALVEVHTEAELEEVLTTEARIIGVNNRDLATLTIDPEHVFDLAPKIPRDRLRVAESGIESRAMLDRLAGVVDAVLIGTAFMQADDVEAKIRELSW